MWRTVGQCPTKMNGGYLTSSISMFRLRDLRLHHHLKQKQPLSMSSDSHLLHADQMES